MGEGFRAIDVANAILEIAEREKLSISNPHLQKVLWYAQGFSFAFDEQPIFDDDFEAWKYGPVIPNVYNRLRRWGAMPVRPEREGTLKTFPEKVQELLENTTQVVGRKDPWGLVDKVKGEAPWKNNYRTGESRIIPKKEIESYFKSAMKEVFKALK